MLMWSLLCNAEEEKGNQRMMEVSRVTEVRFYQMLKKQSNGRLSAHNSCE